MMIFDGMNAVAAGTVYPLSPCGRASVFEVKHV